MEKPSPTDDQVILAGQLKLLQLRQRVGIPVDNETLERTIDLEKRVRQSRRKKAA